METVKLIIDIVSPILVAIITAGLTYASVASKNNKAIDLEQYQKIFSPIHKILNFGKPVANKDMYFEIKDIINENYSLIPESTMLSFNKLTAENFNNNDDEFIKFKNKMDTCHEYLSCTLGYARKKLSPYDKRQTKKVINSTSFDYDLTKMMIKFMIGSLLFSLYINLFINYTDALSFISSVANITMILFTIVSVGYTIFYFISVAIGSCKTKKKVEENTDE